MKLYSYLTAVCIWESPKEMMLYYYNELLVSGRLGDTFDLVHQQTRPKAFDYEFNTSEGIIW